MQTKFKPVIDNFEEMYVIRLPNICSTEQVQRVFSSLSRADL